LYAAVVPDLKSAGVPQSSVIQTRERRRALNLEIQAVGGRFDFGRPLSVVCECGHGDCKESFDLDPTQFALLLARGDLALAPGHADASYEPLPGILARPEPRWEPLERRQLDHERMRAAVA
jgi:hypothetical protein